MEEEKQYMPTGQSESLPQGYEWDQDPDGEPVIRTPEGDLLSIERFLQTKEGSNSPLQNDIVRQEVSRAVKDVLNLRGKKKRVQRHSPGAVSEVVTRIDSLESLSAAIAEEKKMPQMSRNITPIVDYMLILIASGNEDAITEYKSMHKSLISKELWDQFDWEYQIYFNQLTTELQDPKGIAAVAEREKKGEMEFVERLVYKQLVKSIKVARQLVSPEKIAGIRERKAEEGEKSVQPKSATEIREDLMILRQMHADNQLLLTNLMMKHLSDFPLGRMFLATTGEGREYLQNQIREGRMQFNVFAPRGYEDMPSRFDVVIENIEDVDFETRAEMVNGNFVYQTAESPTGKVSIMHVAGKNLGSGAIGEVWSSLVVEQGSAEGRHVVMKKPVIEYSVEHAVPRFDELDDESQKRLKEIYAAFVKIATRNLRGVDVAYAEVSDMHLGHDIKLSTRRKNAFYALLERTFNTMNEAMYAGKIIHHQANGQMEKFLRYYFTTDNGLIFMESVANEHVGDVCDFEKLFDGQIDTLDGVNPITKEVFWGRVADALDGLAEAHELGYVHRDVKPENLGIAPDGEVRILDVGSFRQKSNIAEESFLYNHEYDMMIPARGGIVPKHPSSLQSEDDLIRERPGYYNPDFAQAESSGVIAADGKPVVTYGASDNNAMGVCIWEFIRAVNDEGEYAWANDEEAEALEKIMHDLMQPRSDAREAAWRIREIWGLNK